jgi:hypothetical protein
MSFNPYQFDPSKMDPKALMEMSRLIQQLPPEQLNRMQSLMHNMMAGFNVQKELEEFEKTLPAGFREKLMSVMAPSPSTGPSPESSSEPIAVSSESENPAEPPKNVREARLTLLRAVAEHQMTPEQALQLLFPHDA